MVSKALGFSALLFGLFFGLVEVRGTYEFLFKDQGDLNYIVFAGCGIAAATALLPAWASFAWRGGKHVTAGFLWVLFAMTLVAVVGSGIARTGTSTDQAQEGREATEQKRSGAQRRLDDANSDFTKAEQALTDARANLAKSAPLKLCASACIKGLNDAVAQAEADRDRARQRRDQAGDAVAAAPPPRVDAMARRVHAAFPSVSEDSVRLYWPIVVPSLASALSAFLMALGVWGVSDWRTSGLATTSSSVAASGMGSVPASGVVALVASSPPIEPQPAQVTLAPMLGAPPLEVRDPGARRALQYLGPGSVLNEFASEALERAPDAEEEVSMSDVMRAYYVFCYAKDEEPLDGHAFTRELAALCNISGVKVRAEGPDVYLKGARLVA